MTQTCTCPTCGTEHLIIKQMIVQPVHIISKEEIPKLPKKIREEYEAAKAEFDKSRCLEVVSVSQPDVGQPVEHQCRKARASGSKFCKQHGKLHPGE